jgi:two-component system alkaline phosphatase synthesis response regulator PhoP
MSKSIILIVEDEKNLGSTLLQYLTSKGFEVYWAPNCEEARQLFKKNQQTIRIVLMDKGLPDGDGFELAQEFRSLKKNFVLLFLSALNDPSVRLEGLELGAEDYITKPFELQELLLRLNRILNQQNAEKLEVYTFGKIKFWVKSYEIEDANGIIQSLSYKEASLLSLLINKNKEVVSRDEIIDTIWGQDAFPSNRTIDNMIVKIRKWAESDSEQKLKISSVRGVGYRLEY